VCVPGPIGEKEGVINNAPNLPGWNSINIKRIINDHFRIPVFCANDANASCVAEKIFGQGKKVSNLCYVTVSTGIGSGIIINNNLVTGINNYAGEIGHMPIDLNGPRCNCGKVGCLEALSSGTAIQAMAVSLVSNKTTWCRRCKITLIMQNRKYKREPTTGRMTGQLFPYIFNRIYDICLGYYICFRN